MDSTLKDEFKEFISTLSKEICREVLEDELRNINKIFNETADRYKNIGSNYETNVNEVKKQLNQLQDINLKLDSFILNIKNNNENITNALNMINSGYKDLLKSLMEENKNMVDEYNKNFHLTNDIERDSFISKIDTLIEVKNKRHTAEFIDLFNREGIKEAVSSICVVLNNINTMSSKINALESHIKSLGQKCENIESKMNNI